MALWLLRGLRRRVVTTRYPARPDPSAALLASPPAFDPRRLTPELADRLVRLCPSPRALRRDGDELLLDVGACTACGRCIEAAGAAARPSGVFELAATDSEQLRKRIPIQGATP
jgi:ferredoxin